MGTPVDDVTVSGAALLLFTGILSAVVGALVSMFHLAWKERDRSDERMRTYFTAREGQYEARYSELAVLLQRILTEMQEVTAAVHALHVRQHPEP